MESNRQAAVAGGTSLSTLLGVAFIVLKLTHVIDWAWWLVLLPIYLGPAILLAAALFFLVMAGFCYVGAWLTTTRKEGRPPSQRPR